MSHGSFFTTPASGDLVSVYLSGSVGAGGFVPYDTDETGNGGNTTIPWPTDQGTVPTGAGLHIDGDGDRTVICQADFSSTGFAGGAYLQVFAWNDADGFSRLLDTDVITPGLASTEGTLQVTKNSPLKDGDVVYAIVTDNTGGTATINGGADRSFLQAA